jgi:antitoxin component YwqK of YwqJK toxin-antitoxin module
MDQPNVWCPMRKFFGGIVSARMLIVCGACSLSMFSCSQPSLPPQEVVKTTYYHTYGPQIAESDWQTRGATGEVVEILKNGVEVRREYVGGVLHGTSSWTFPHTKVIDRIEQYKNGSRVLAARNYASGSPEFQEEWLDDDHTVVRAWYNDGSPRLIEECRGSFLIAGQYFTIDGDIESSVAAGTGMKIERSQHGDMINRKQLKAGDVIVTESFYPNGQLREVIAYQGGDRHGQGRRYSESGEPISIEQWAQGVLNGAQLFFEGGQPVRQVSYAMGKKEGLELHFRPGTEEVVEEISWRQDKRHGPSKTYLADQTLTEWYWRGSQVSEQQYAARDSMNVAYALPKK